LFIQPKEDWHVTLDVCAKAPLGTRAAAARTTINDHALESGDMVDRRKMGKTAEASELHIGM
jgi:hypothetical protein